MTTTNHPEDREVFEAQTGFRNILFDLVPEDYLLEILKRLDRLIDAKIHASKGSKVLIMTDTPPTDMAKLADELKPCPFCGSGCHLADTDNKWIACNSCDAEGPVRYTEQEAIAAWNTRTPSPPALALNARTVEDSLALAWKRYEHRFGEPPHGTAKHIAALVALMSQAPPIRTDRGK